LVLLRMTMAMPLLQQFPIKAVAAGVGVALGAGSWDLGSGTGISERRAGSCSSLMCRLRNHHTTATSDSSNCSGFYLIFYCRGELRCGEFLATGSHP